MASRLELQTKLEELLGSRNVYYQPPENLKLEYPAIVYSKTGIDTKKANNGLYLKTNRYEIIVIDKKPDNNVIGYLLATFFNCSHERHYKADNLNHDVFTLYY